MLVYDVSARDLDSGVNGIVDYSFIYDGHSTQRTPEFRINKATGVIHAEIVYDRENVNQYVVSDHFVIYVLMCSIIYCVYSNLTLQPYLV